MTNFQARMLKELQYRFQKEGRWAITNRDAVQMLMIVISGRKKLWSFYRQKNRSKMRLAEWLYDSRKGLWRFLRLWEVLEDLRWRQRRGRFYGDLLQISWADLCKELRCSRSQLRRLLSLLEKAGVITRWSWKLKGKKVKVLRIRLNVFRLNDLIDRAARVTSYIAIKNGETVKGAKQIDTRAGGYTDARDSKTKNMTSNSSEPARAPGSPILCIKDVVFPCSVEKERICTSSGDVKILLNKHPETDQSQLQALPASPVPSEYRKLAAETFRIVQHLKRVYPAAHFTMPRLLQIDRLVTKQLPAYRMSEDRIKFYVNELRSGDRHGEWQFRVSKLESFIRYWPKVLEAINQAKYVDTALNGVEALNHFTPAHWMQELQEEALNLSRRVAATVEQGVSVVEDFAAKIPKCWELQHTTEPVRWLAFSFLGDPMQHMAKRSGLLKGYLFTNHGMYHMLKHKLPLKKWAALTDEECHTLDELGQSARWNMSRKVLLADVYGIQV